MDKKEFMKVFGDDLTELKVTGSLNASIVKTMSKDDIKRFLEKDVTELAKRFINKQWSDNVQVRCEYQIVDSYLNKKGIITAYMNYSHDGGATDCTFEKKNL